MAGTVVVVDHPLIQHKLTRMRRVETPVPEFRQLMRETSLLLAYEVTRNLPMTSERITTPLEEMDAPTLAPPNPILISILRAGNALVEGMLDLMPFADVGHVGLYRDHDTLEAIEYYFKVPENMPERPVIIGDPMLATGNSSVAAIDRLKRAGARDLRLVCLLAAPEGIAALEKAHPDLAIFTAAIDSHLNEKGYIVPGLGDAGDRIYGTK